MQLQPVVGPLDASDGCTRLDSGAKRRQRRNRRIGVKLLQRHGRHSDVARVRFVQQARPEDLDRQGERRIVGREVQRRQGNQVPERCHSVVRLAVLVQPAAEGLAIELGIGGIERTKRKRSTRS